MNTVKNISYGLLLVFVIALISFAITTFALRTYIEKLYIPVSEDQAVQFFDEYCSDKTNWYQEAGGYIGAIADTPLDFFTGNYKISYYPIVFVEDIYIVRFLGEDPFGHLNGTVSNVTNKNTSQEIQGKERDRITKAAIEKVKGQTSLILSYHARIVNDEPEYFNFSCTVP